ncbi:hypothetical protein SERLA73DRAFT_177283 [Serpula lacrymans var. lacrymans S7.3]|uniref:Uncharacterized protein n=1 Tax=Serpula lacrymans var. lacrymans (strain S7.3) TaxID=936435 RepID=F8PNQ8_SERL3|nr:hypothetical protein SERLA73DRAFT_177283 [Serpula lacrymans var. lacrymans S7.3]
MALHHPLKPLPSAFMAGALEGRSNVLLDDFTLAVSSSSMPASALPSFIELMASLGLNDARTSQSDASQTTRSRSCSVSSSTSSSSIQSLSPSSSRSSFGDVSPRDLESERRSNHAGSRVRVARYNPYAPPHTCVKRSSMSSLTDQTELETPSRSHSSSPRSPSPRITRRPSPLRFQKLLGELDRGTELPANTPISTYVRRKTPQHSPTVSTFSHRYTDRPSTISPPSLIPFSLPTLPSAFVAPH